MQPDHIQRLSTPTPAGCAICRRRAGPYGYTLREKLPLWACHDEECRELIRWINDMPTPDFDNIESEAIIKGGQAGYVYLDFIDKENVFELEPDEATEFFERVIDGFGAHMREKLIAKRDGK